MSLPSSDTIPGHAPGAGHAATVLVVEDSPAERARLSALVERLGFRCLSCADGLDALEVLRRRPVDLVLSDWIMPRLDGLGLCRALQAEWGARRPHFIMLTGRSQGADLIAGMDAGADDYIGKPAPVEELRVRLQSGCRQLRLRRQLERSNETLQHSLDREQQSLAQVRRDLEAAAQVQRSFLPATGAMARRPDFAWLFRPQEQVSGDGLGVHELAPGIFAAFVLDVCGHGVTAAMQSIGLQRRLVPESPQDSLLMRAVDQPAPPCEVVRKLNQMQYTSAQDCQLVTLAYAVLDTRRRRGQLCLAGHPQALLLQGGGDTRLLGEPNPPLGVLPECHFTGTEFDWMPSDSLLLYTDGLVDRGRLGRERQSYVESLRACLRPLAGAPAETVKTGIRDWLGVEPGGDDASALVISL